MTQRRSIRLQDYDYAQNGAYFVTICTHNRDEIFGEIVDGAVHLNPVGTIISECWQKIPDHFPNVELDEFVIMPNHLHGILVITGDERARYIVPLQNERFGKPVAGSLPTIMRTFKAAVSRFAKKLDTSVEETIWQRNYHEHVIRSEVSLNKIREYIQANPVQWENDSENPVRRKA